MLLELTKSANVIDIFDVEIKNILHIHMLQPLRQIGNGRQRPFRLLLNEEVLDGFRVDQLVFELRDIHFLEVGVHTACVDVRWLVQEFVFQFAVLEEDGFVFNLSKAPLPNVLALLEVIGVLLIWFDDFKHFWLLKHRSEVFFWFFTLLVVQCAVDYSREFDINILALPLIVDVYKVLM